MAPWLHVDDRRTYTDWKENMLSLSARACHGLEADVHTAYQISFPVCPDKHKEEKKARQEIEGGGRGCH